jgi:5-methylcytosine-specific restriction endonuclease McrA
MTPALREQVRQRAADLCEYCGIPQACTTLPHEADHIRSQKHHGPTALDNLCWACALCNGFKGSDVAGHDPVTDELVPLFNPRKEVWQDHFAWNGSTLTGSTKSGRATIELLQINRHERIEHRRLLTLSGQFQSADFPGDSS